MQKDGVEVLILGCAGMAVLDKEIEEAVKVPVIEVVCALMIIESFVRYGVGISKIANQEQKKLH